jgi:hypothetical protein
MTFITEPRGIQEILEPLKNKANGGCHRPIQCLAPLSQPRVPQDGPHLRPLSHRALVEVPVLSIQADVAAYFCL